MSALTKQERLEEANKVIEAIAAHGRRFFYSGPGSDPSEGGVRAKRCPEGRVARFEFDGRGAVCFRDDYSWERILVVDSGRWKGWSHGGTMRSLVIKLRDYIRTGEPISVGWFGPWPDWMSQGDLWGYGADAMALVREAALKTQAVKAAGAVAS